MTSSVMSVEGFQPELPCPPAASSKLDLHAWIALGLAGLVASGIMTMVVIAYSRVP